MTFKHCAPCNHFDICPICEQETCQTCGESIDSPHIQITAEGHEELQKLKDEEILIPARFCNECLFYAYHDINNPLQADYDHDMIFEIKTERFEVYKPWRGNIIKEKRSVVLTGIKPEPPLPYIWGPFIITENEQSRKLREAQDWRQQFLKKGT